MPRYHRRSVAFSLIELMIVIAIISILVVISIVSFASSQRKSRDVQRKTAMLNIAAALEQYHTTHNVYAPEYCSVATLMQRNPGLGCYANYNPNDTYRGGLGYADYVTAGPNGDDGPNPLFLSSQVDALKPYTGYLLPYMSEPPFVPGTISTNGGADETIEWPRSSVDQEGSFSLDVLVTSMRATYYVTAQNYWLRIALENRNEPRVPAPSGTCYYWDRGGGNTGGSNFVFHDFVASAFNYTDGTPCDSQLKFYARGNLHAPSF